MFLSANAAIDVSLLYNIISFGDVALDYYNIKTNDIIYKYGKHFTTFAYNGANSINSENYCK